MNDELLFHYCKCIYQLFHVPIRIFREGKLIKRFDNAGLEEFEQGRAMSILSSFSGWEHENPVEIKFSASLFMEGAVFDESSDLFVYFGFARSAAINEKVAHRYFESLKINDLPREGYEKMYRYLIALPKMQPGRFSLILSGMNAFLNGSIVPLSDLYEENLEGNPDTEINEKIIIRREKEYYEEVDRIEFREFEKRLLFYVKNGMVKELVALGKDLKGFNLYGGRDNPDAWRLLKDDCVQGVALVSRAAIDGGLSPHDGLQLNQFYTQKAELASSVTELNELRYNMLIDFAERVNDLRFPKADNAVVSYVADYIIEHLEDKISLTEVAERANVSKAYLCTKFKEEMGVGITDFINYQKVLKAKQMLKFSDKTLSQIASYLSFCSQSYFQFIFREVTGMTPTEYRDAEET